MQGVRPWGAEAKREERGNAVSAATRIILAANRSGRETVIGANQVRERQIRVNDIIGRKTGHVNGV